MMQDDLAPRARLLPTGEGRRAVSGTEVVFSEIDLRRVRRYLRLAAVIPALLLIAGPLLVDWLLMRYVEVDIGSAWIIIPTVLLIVGGVGVFLKSELRLRTYYFLLADDALVYEFGQSRTFLELEHVQILDHEASLLLRCCGLCRLSLHTAGGTVIVCPVPVEIPPVLEQRIYYLAPAALHTS